MRKLIYILLFVVVPLSAQHTGTYNGKIGTYNGHIIKVQADDIPTSPENPTEFTIINQTSFSEFAPGLSTAARWQTYLNSSDISSSWLRDSTRIIDGDTVEAMYIMAVYNSNGTSAHGRMFLNGSDNTDDTLTYVNLEYYMKLSSNWDYSDGGKLPGLAGDRTAGDGITYGDNSAGVYLYSCGTAEDYEITDGFSARGGFNGPGISVNNNIGFYYYHHDLTEFDPTCTNKAYGDYFKPWAMPTLDTWYKVRERFVLNTIASPGNGNNDGFLEYYINDILVDRQGSIRFRNYESVSIDLWSIQAFCGGGGTDAGRTDDQFVFIDDLTLWQDGDKSAHTIGNTYPGPNIGSDNRDSN